MCWKLVDNVIPIILSYFSRLLVPDWSIWPRGGGSGGVSLASTRRVLGSSAQMCHLGVRMSNQAPEVQGRAFPACFELT